MQYAFDLLPASMRLARSSMLVLYALLLSGTSAVIVRCPAGMYVAGDCYLTGNCLPCAACPVGRFLVGAMARSDDHGAGAPSRSAADCMVCGRGEWATRGSERCYACPGGRAVRRCAAPKCAAPTTGQCHTCDNGRWAPQKGTDVCAEGEPADCERVNVAPLVPLLEGLVDGAREAERERGSPLPTERLELGGQRSDAREPQAAHDQQRESIQV